VANSQTSANLEACWPKALRLDGSLRGPNALHMAVLERVRQRAHDFDLLHFHLDYYPFSLFSRQPTPFVIVRCRDAMPCNLGWLKTVTEPPAIMATACMCMAKA
jgi:hypothetical protein